MRHHLIVLAGVLLTGCATATHLNRVSVGMTKQQVIATMGAPASTRATQGTEYLMYRLSKDSILGLQPFPTDYYVRLVNGRVDAYGEMGDFDSTHPPEQKLDVDLNVKQNP